jgi:thiol-disulfide isomerase/thioredoxin
VSGGGPRGVAVWSLALALGAGLLAGCADGGAGGGAGAGARPSSLAGPDAAIASAAARAQLDACPASDTGVSARADGLPDVTLTCLDSAGPATVRLSGLRGRPTVLNVWAQWCPPCRAEAPLLQRLHAAAGDRLVVLGVDYQDDAVPALAFAQAHGLHYPSVSAPTDEFPLRRYGPGPPVTLLVDASGRVARVVRGPFHSWAELSGTVADVLGVDVAGVS